MARTIFLILVFLNLAVFAWVYLTGDAKNNAGREPDRSKAQLAADRIRILPPVDVAISPVSAPVGTLPPAAVAKDVCQGYAGATAGEAQQVVKALTEKLPTVRVSANPVVAPPVFDLAIPSLVSRAVAETKLAELKKLGIGGGVQIRTDDDNKHFSVLIASFDDKIVAEEALKSAVKKGVRSAVVGERKVEVEKVMIEVRGNEAMLKKLPEQVASFKMLSPAACLAQ